jgi:hypothetical protein
MPAGRHAGARLGAGTVAGLAADQRRHVDLDGAADKGFFQRDVEIVPEVGTAQPRLSAATGSAGPSAHEVAEDVLEDVRHRRAELGPEAGGAAAGAILEGSMAEAVIGGALLRILQAVIGLGYFLELVFGIVVAGIAVRMELHGKLAVGAFQRRLVGPLRHAEHFVEIAFGQIRLFPIRPAATARQHSKRPR